MSIRAAFLSLAISFATITFTPAFAEEAKPAAPAATAAPAEKPAPTPEEQAKVLAPQPTDHILGNPDAPLLVVEYASLSCTHCAHFHGETFPQLKEKYIDTNKIAFIFRHFPLNEPALRGAILAECSGDKFYTFLKVMFQSQDKWAFSQDFLKSLHTLANVGGLGSEKFDQCLADKKLESSIVLGLQSAADTLQVHSTPTLFIGSDRIDGFRNFEELTKLIDAKLPK